MHDLFLILLGAWLHQLLRVGAMLSRPPEAIHRAGRSDRLVVARLRRGSWSSQLRPEDRADLQRLRTQFIWNFYVFLILPMSVCIVWLVFTD